GRVEGASCVGSAESGESAATENASNVVQVSDIFTKPKIISLICPFLQSFVEKALKNGDVTRVIRAS
ncbi:hypothetical protein, partial [uncultured Sphingomonas sp.]|uniref:hypothetical protein n=1 Tax=uncultured Sphingomonas sp. TaxID=158754 RepID=UPI0025D207BE